MNNDLISRSELKKNIDKFIGYLDEDMIYRIKVVIDNAPTIEYPFYAEAYQTGFEEGKNERPQGEWKEFKYGLYYCSRCFERVDKDIERIETLVSKDERSNYCSVCGAKMEGCHGNNKE